MKPEKKDLLKEEIRHFDITEINATQIIEAWQKMSFTSRDAGNAASIVKMMMEDNTCSNVLVLAGSTSAGGCMKVYADMVKHNMVDIIVATGASVIDMDFFEALGFKHYKGRQDINDNVLRELLIDRIYDTFIDEEELQKCDAAIAEITNSLATRPYSSREFIWEMGKWLTTNSSKKESLIQLAYEKKVPIFCPAFSDSSAGFGLVAHQRNKIIEGKTYLTIDSAADFRELTELKIMAGRTGLIMIGGGVPKNFMQDTVVCAEVAFDKSDMEMHRYAVQITVADVRDGACSSSTLKEAASWGKVDTTYEQMVFAEATTIIPLIASYIYHSEVWMDRTDKKWADWFLKSPGERLAKIKER